MDSAASDLEQTTARGIVRAVIVELEPGEVAALDGLLRYDDAQVGQWLRKRRRGGGTVGFGFNDVALVLTPVVWMVVDEAMRDVVGKGIDESAKGLGGLFRRMLRRRKKVSTPPALPPLDEDQLARVRAIVAASAKRRGVSQRRAAEIAELVAKQLERDDGQRERK